MINICLLGATGSIGSQVLDLIKDNEKYRLIAFSFGNNIKQAIEIVREFKPLFVSGKTLENAITVKEAFPSIEIGYGSLGLQQVATYNQTNLYNKQHEYIVINALVGSIGLLPTIAAINIKRKILLANKETLVIGGEIIIPLAKKNGVDIIPIDSEHSAIFQLINENNQKDIRKLIITASGGALFDKSRTELPEVTIEEALNHPNWQMGAKITIDCATMMNKAFELIEAHYLFNIPMEQIIPVIHKESIIHSMVEFNDGSIYAQMGVADMHLPIQYALNYPNHLTFNNQSFFDFNEKHTIHFEPLDENRFPLISLAKEIIKKGNVYPTIMNAANSTAVELFLNKQISFDQIETIIFETINDPTYVGFTKGELSANKIITLDELVRNNILQKYERRN